MTAPLSEGILSTREMLGPDDEVAGAGVLSSSFSVEMGDLLEVDLPAEIDSGSRHRVKVVWVKPHSLFAEVGVMKVVD